jgi:hypothetical protein
MLNEKAGFYLSVAAFIIDVREGLHQLVEASLDPDNEEDAKLVANTCSYWLDVLKFDLKTGAMLPVTIYS